MNSRHRRRSSGCGKVGSVFLSTFPQPPCSKGVQKTNHSQQLLTKFPKMLSQIIDTYRDTNHCISKKLVAKAKDTNRAIALEDLRGIRQRVTVRRSQRATLHSWAFFQLRSFVTYKAKGAGVPVFLVDPRNTSRTCPACGHVDKANRLSQSKFSCVVCGFAGLADQIAAINIGRRAAVNPPIVARDEAKAVLTELR